MIFEHTCSREFLKAELSKRVAKNPKYSLRAFARDLGLSPSHFSLVLSGKKNLSDSAAIRVADLLKLSSSEARYFFLLIRSLKTTSSKEMTRINVELVALRSAHQIIDISLDAFQAISDWYHVAILELTQVEPRLTPRFISEKLGITEIEANTALERLIRLNLLKKRGEEYLKSGLHPIVRSENPNEALRAFHRQMLDKARGSLTTQTTRQKFIGSETLAVSASDLPRAFEQLEQFLTEFPNLSRAGGRKEKIYHLGVQFFDVTTQKERRDT